MKKDQRIIHVQGDAAFDKAQIHKQTYNVSSNQEENTYINSTFAPEVAKRFSPEQVIFLNKEFADSLQQLIQELNSISHKHELLEYLEDLTESLRQEAPKKSKIRSSWEFIKNQMMTLNNLNGAVSLADKLGKGISIILTAI